jgi:cysteinyl-tRNA synthetase
MLEYSPTYLQEAATGYRRIENFLQRAEELVGTTANTSTFPEAFRTALDDDLGISQALAVLADTVRLGNSAIATGDQEKVRQSMNEVRSMLSVLGCDPLEGPWQSNQQNLNGVVDALVSVVLEQRNSARARKDYQAADEIRDGLAAAGIHLEDAAGNTRWSLKRGSE